MAKKTKSVKAAEKALAKARIAVSNAGRAVKKLDKKTRRKADELQRELVEAEKSAKKSVERAERTESKRRASRAEQITVHRIADPGSGTTVQGRRPPRPIVNSGSRRGRRASAGTREWTRPH